MKIVIDARCLMNEQYSGVSWYAFNLLKALFELDRNNKYFLFYNSSKPIKLPEFNYPNVFWYGFRYPNKLFNLLLNFLHWPKLDKLVGGCDIFFSPNLHFVSLSLKCRHVVTVHDLSFLVYPEFFTSKQRLWHKLILKNKILEKAVAIMTDSNNTKKDLIDLINIPSEKIYVCPLGVNQIYRPIEDNLELNRVKQKYNLPNNFVLSLGSLEPRKNLIGVIKAFNKINTTTSLVIAGANGWKNNEIKSLATKDSRIKLIGYVDEMDKPVLYSLALTLVYPSFYEGFGLPIIEAMACGTPVIAGANSSQGEVLANAGLLVDSYDINQIAEAIELIINNQSLRQEFIRRGIEQVKQFNWYNTAQRILQIFKNL